MQLTSVKMETEDKEEGGEDVRNKLITSSDKRVTFDDILSHPGEFGTSQKIIYLMFSLPYIASASQLMGWVFVGAEMPHRY